MKALRLNQPGQLEFFHAPEPAAPQAGEALVRVLRTGICGTDLHAFRGKQPFFTYPRILGHELAVEVLALGPGAEGVAPGDVCCVEPFLNCGTCPACRRGKTNCCESLKTLGVHIDGAMQERYVLPARKLHRAPGLRPEQLATVEPLCIGSHAVWRAQPEAGDSLLVIGGGPIGLAVVEASRALGIEPLMMEMSQTRMAFAEKQVKLQVVDARQDVKEQLRAKLDGELPRVIVDCTGNKASMESCFELIAHGGKVVYVGIHLGELSFYNPNYHAREVTLLSSRNATATDFRRVLDNLASGKSTSDYWLNAGLTPPEEVAAEFPKWLDVEAGLIKPVITWA